MKKTTSLILALLLFAALVFSAASCAKGGGGGDGTTEPVASSAPVADGTEGAETEEITTDLLAHVNQKYDGELNVLYWEDAENQEYFSEGQNGAEVNDAIFRRNASVEERLGIKLKFTPTLGNSSKAKDFLSFVQANYKAGDVKFDAMSAHSRSIGLCAYNGLTQNMDGLGALDPSKPWWPKLLTNTCRINGQLHFLSGDISTNMLYMMYTVFCNKDLLDDLRKTDPFDLVKSGEWTIDKLAEYCRDVYTDEDNDGKTVTDRFGIVTSKLHCDAFLYGSGIVGVENNNGTLVLSDSFTGDKMITLIDKIFALLTDSRDGIIDSGYKSIFRDGRSLFVVDRADIAINDLSEKKFETMTILPVPKFDADQNDYLTAIGNPFSLYAIPANAEDPEMSATFFECMAGQSYIDVTPVIFEISMKTRYASGGNDAYSYDLIRAGAVYDPSRIFWKVFSDAGKAPDTLFQDQLASGSSGWSKTVKGNQRAIENTIKKINEAFGIS